MRALCAALAAGALIVCFAAATPLRADEDCDNVTRDLGEAIAIALKNFDQTMADLKKIMSEPADDKKKATVKNTFCSVSGEFLGASRAARAVTEVCAGRQSAEIASFEKSIKEMETAIGNTRK
jgi:hypothetical protein